MQTLSQDQDLTGKNRRTYNVIIGWLGQLVFVASGFILPRMIDNNLGQETLGIWDFAWTLITYFEFIYSGLVSSVNRYVAKHRATGNIDGVNIAVSSVFFTLLVLAVLVALLTTTTALALPHFLQARLGDHTTDTQWVIFFLGLSLVVKISLAVFAGILTGCHRWDLQHGINATNRVLALLGMTATLAMGGQLPAITLVFLCCETLVFSSRCSLAFRICPGLKISLRLARLSTIKNMWRFGLKTLLPDLSDLLSNQTFNLLLVWFLGPAALAVYARPRGIVRHIQAFIRRYTNTLTPTASSLQAISTNEEINTLIVSSCRTGTFITIPMVSVLAIMGGPLLQIWMGQKYADDILSLALALGYLPVLLQLPLNNLLQGFNTHGWPGLFKFIAAITGIGFALLALGVFNTGILFAAVTIFLPFWVSELIITPFYAARRHAFSLRHYWLVGILQPLLITTPMIISLLIFRLFITAQPAWVLFGGISTGLSTFFISFWFFEATDDFRKKVGQRLILFKKSQIDYISNLFSSFW